MDVETHSENGDRKAARKRRRRYNRQELLNVAALGALIAAYVGEFVWLRSAFD